MNNASIQPEARHENDAPAVLEIQTYLRQLAHHDAKIPFVPLDGIYASRTREAVSEFQRQSGLPVTGVVDQQTFERLYLAYLRSLTEVSPPQAIAPFPREPEGYTIGQGEESDLVMILHILLRALAQVYDTLGEIPAGMQYTAQTERAVREFQQRNALSGTGRVDRPTWNALARAFNRTVTNSQ